MSLLMDALKKAEQEKKEAAKRQQEIEPAAEGDHDQASPKTLDDTDTWGHEIADGSTTAEIKSPPDAEKTGLHSTTAELELEPISSADDTAEIPQISTAAASSGVEDPTLNVTINELSLADLAASDAEQDDADAAAQTPASIDELQTDIADLDETFHGVGLHSTLVNPELFQETVQGEAYVADDASQTWGETLPGIPAAQLASDIGGEDQPTPVAAQTVFTATGTTQSSGTGFRWALAGMCLIVLVAASVYIYYTVTPTNRTSVRPQIAQGIERVGPPLHETLVLNIKPVTGTAAGSKESLAGTLAGEETATQDIDTTEPQVSSADDNQPVQPDAQEKEIASAEPAGDDRNVATAVDELPPVAGDSQQSAMPASLPETIEPEPSLIRISRSKAPDDKGKAIRDAYFAYQKGAYGTAAEKYQETLKEFPENRDALLGLGAIAANNGDYESAYRLYARLLKLNPGDKFAKAALINLQDKTVLANSESVINSMLHDSPDTHFLHFTLGNIYAAGERWAQAQQAFFDAYRLNSGNPDYALNLAISLDHIGQYGTALDYYNTALELSNNTPSRFDSSPVRKRIEDLGKVAEH